MNAAFVQAHGTENLPIIMESGQAIGTATPTGVPATATATILPAWKDNDSQEHPIAHIIFDPLGTNTLIYGGDVSAPDGDTQDWIQFTPYKTDVYVSIECRGTQNLQIDLLENGGPTQETLACGDHLKDLDVKPGSTYLVHVQAPSETEGLQSINYTITIQMSL